MPSCCRVQILAQQAVIEVKRRDVGSWKLAEGGMERVQEDASFFRDDDARNEQRKAVVRFEPAVEPHRLQVHQPYSSASAKRRTEGASLRLSGV